MSKILVINPGSTSTKIAVYDNHELLVEETLRHKPEDLIGFETITDQYEFREKIVLDVLKTHGIQVAELDAVVGRGGLVHPLEGGCYRVNTRMIQDLKAMIMGEHASNLGALIAKAIGDSIGKPAFIVDPVVVDELEPLARYSGHPKLQRISIFHALNQKAVAHRVAQELNKPYTACNLIVVHLGGGISVGAHKHGKVVDVNNALDGDGPFSPERSGGLPVGQLVTLCFSAQYTEAEIKKMMKGQGGLVAYIGTNDGRETVKRIKAGNLQAREVFEAMAYQVAKEIGAMAAVLHGSVDAIVLTGGLAYNQIFVEWITQRVQFIAPVKVVPGEDEMVALNEGALRVLTGEEEAKEYQG
ncbi:MAG: butyrate kinase [Candidatus Vecturithrix sp.]|nr:butyrate kinase [Candidatus Vecturithrix sp.]